MLVFVFLIQCDNSKPIANILWESIDSPTLGLFVCCVLLVFGITKAKTKNKQKERVKEMWESVCLFPCPTDATTLAHACRSPLCYRSLRLT